MYMTLFLIKTEEYITQTQINAGDLENPNGTVPGRMECSDNNYLCDYDNCTLQKNTI